MTAWVEALEGAVKRSCESRPGILEEKAKAAEMMKPLMLAQTFAEVDSYHILVKSTCARRRRRAQSRRGAPDVVAPRAAHVARDATATWLASPRAADDGLPRRATLTHASDCAVRGRQTSRMPA